MKNFFILLFALSISSLSAQWQQLSAPGMGGFRHIVESNGQLFGATDYSPVHRSASNGLTWQATTPFPVTNGSLNLSMDAENNLIAILVVDGITIKAFQSTDDAQSWQQLPNFTGQSTFSDEIYVSNGTVYCYKAGDGQLVRLDNNTTWTPVLSISSFQWTFAFLGDKIWAGTNNSLQYSPNKGGTWQTITTSPFFTWVSSIAAYNNELVVASDNGVYHSNSNGVSWSPGTLAGDPSLKVVADDGDYYAWLNDVLYSSLDGLTYTQILSGQSNIRDMAAINGFLVASTNILYRSLQNPISWQGVFTGVSENYVTLHTAGGVLFYLSDQTAFSTDDGDTWQITDISNYYFDIIHHNGTWYGQYYNKIWQSTNLTNWLPIATLIPGADSASQVWTYFGNTMVHVGYNDKNVYISNDNGQSWQTAGALPSSPQAQQVFTYNNLLYVHDYNSNELFSSADFGNSWQEVGADVLTADPNVYVNTELTTTGKIYAISDQNLLTSTDGGLTWSVQSLQPIVPTGSGLYVAGTIAFNGGLLALVSNDILYITQDNGANWIASMAGFTSVPSNRMTTSGNTVFVLDNNSIPWRRNNLGANVTQYSGLVYNDLNNNSLQDSGEPPLPNAILHLTNNNQYTISGSTGTFNFFTETPNDVLTAYYPGKYCSFNPPNYTVNTTNTQLNFGLYCPPSITDLAVSLVNSTVFRPGFDTDIFLTARNLGNDAANGTVKLTLDPAVQFVSATPPTPLVGNMLTWSFSAFQSLDQMSFVVRVNTPANTPLGTILCHAAQITPNATDQNPADNAANLCGTVVGSYDPNDKQVSPELLSPANVSAEKPLIYTVRFQNTGTYLASLVVIRDTLSSNLDPATLQVLNASHPFTWSLRGNGIVEFRFDGINLPDINSDEPGSHGFVQFSILPRSTLQLGDMAANTAYIYFDFNAPIITNTVKTTVVSTREPVSVVQLSALPNPAHETARILLPERRASGILVLHLYDLSGRLIQTVYAAGEEAQFDVRRLASGTYQVRGSDEKRIYVAKFEVVH